MPRSFSGQRLRHARLRAGLKPERLAMLVDRSVYTIHEYEWGRSLPSVPALAALSDVLGCPIDDFFEAVNDAVAA